MQLTEHNAGPHHQIHGVEPGRVRVSGNWYESSLLVGARYLDPDWPVERLEDLDEQSAAPLIALGPELVIVGCGRRQRFLPHAVQREFIRHGIGIECMTLDAAARTFNVLMSENRRALAAMIMEPKVPAGS